MWRAFDDDEDEDYDDEYDEYDDGDWDGRGTRDQSFDSFESNPFPQVQSTRHRGGGGRDGDIQEEEEEYEMLDGLEEDEGDDDYGGDDLDDNVSVYSGMSPRYSVAALGVGMGFGLSGGVGSPLAGMGGRQARQQQSQYQGRSRAGSRSFANGGHGNSLLTRSISQSIFSPPLPSSSSRAFPIQPKQYPHPKIRRPSAGTHQTQQQLHTPPSSLPTSPKTRPHRSLPASSSSGGIPSIQLHVHITHTSNITLTLLTSLQVNYPSSLFMSLPLKLCVTGMTIDADLVLAYANTEEQDTAPPNNRRRQARRPKGDGGGSKGKVHISLTDEDPNSIVPVGQRIIPNVQIESEIGDGDVHVLRNVGKVERFIVEALRKTIVDELVFPNFHTVVL